MHKDLREFSEMAAVATAAVKSESTPRVAAVLGGSGAVGTEVVQQLVSRPEEWGKVLLVNRRNVAALAALPRVSEHVVDMPDGGGAALSASAEAILRDNAVDAIFVTMGVGRPSKVDEAELQKVDVELPAAFASAAKQAGVRHCSLLTAVGADASATPSTLPFFRTSAGGGLYNQCKGRIEQEVKALQFSSLSSFRPAALIGTPNTPGAVAWLSTKVFDGVVPLLYKSSHITTLASAMVFDAEQCLRKASNQPQCSWFEGKELHDLYASAIEAFAAKD